jgi:hypothetical protein
MSCQQDAARSRNITTGNKYFTNAAELKYFRTAARQNYYIHEEVKRISGSHGGEYEDGCLLGCSAV